MDRQQLRVVAFVAAKLLQQNRCINKIFDLQDARETRLTGEVKDGVISLFDHDRHDYIVGHRKTRSEYSLLDLAAACFIRLELLEPSHFRVSEARNGTLLNGTVEGGMIVLFDERQEKTYRYRACSA